MEVTGPLSFCVTTREQWQDTNSSTETWALGFQEYFNDLCVCATSLHLPTQPPGGTGQITTQLLTQKGHKTHYCGGWRVGRCNAQVRHQSQAGVAVPACTAPGQRAQHTWPTLPVQECSVTGGNRNQIPPGNSGKAYPAKGARRKPGINRSLSN